MQCVKKNIVTVVSESSSDTFQDIVGILDAIVAAINIFIARKTLERCRIAWRGFRNVIRRRTGIVFARGNNMLPT